MKTAQHARVLVVDDDGPIRESLCSLLEDLGYHVAEAANGLKALEILRGDTQPRVVLLDLRMPELDGAGVLGAIAADRALAKRTAFILMSATLATLPLAFANLLLDLKVPVVHKPFDIDGLLETIAQAAARLPRA